VRRVVGARTAGAWNLATASLMFGRTIEDVKRAETLPRLTACQEGDSPTTFDASSSGRKKRI
jgi:hypothetical protein